MQLAFAASRLSHAGKIQEKPLGPGYPKSQWKLELSSIFDATTTLSNDVIFLGDFNCDMMEPNKPPMDGRDLCDLLDIYNLKNLITSPIRITKTSKTLLDLILTNNKKRILSSGVVDVQISDHSLVFTILLDSQHQDYNREKFMPEVIRILTQTSF